MLTDAQVERWSRQIVLPEVGARGQERLLGARVALVGDGTVAADLLARAGVGTVERGQTLDADVTVAMTTEISVAVPPAPGRPSVVGVLDGPRAVVATLVWRSCLRCFADVWSPAGDPAGDDQPEAPARLAFGALVATETLRVLVAPPALSRLTVLDLREGTALVREIAPSGCARCGGLA
jgi:hypothetical protein